MTGQTANLEETSDRPKTAEAGVAPEPRGPVRSSVGKYHAEASILQRIVIEVDQEPKANRWRRRRLYKLKQRSFDLAVWNFGLLLRLVGLFGRGVRNALDIELTRLEVAFPDLPPAFDGYRLLHLSDIHIDAHPELVERIVALVADAEAEADVCVLTGDYRFGITGPWKQIMPAMERLAGALNAPDGCFATLGNHDTAQMVEPFEALGLRILMNETVSIERGGEWLHLTGVDDVHFFRTDRALRALRTAPAGFRIALIHSPDLAGEAAAEGVALYLTGHTHGGQICLPGGTPIITSSAPRQYASGLWRHGAMTGYTSRGVGTSSLPVRFNSRGEATLITLRRGSAET